MSNSQDLETATTAIHVNQLAQPDSKTRRYDRQLRLWAASGQSALESARVLVVSASATSTSILKNLVLPGVGHFTILDHGKVTADAAGNNFFFEGPDSVGKSRAQEAVRLLKELNESVEGNPDTTSTESRLADVSYLGTFDLVITHNLTSYLLESLSNLLWANPALPPLVVVRSAGFLAEFFVQIHEHTVIDSHPETAPSLRIDKPFTSLLDHARGIDLDSMDVTDHGHIPYVVILIRTMEDWKTSHNGKQPKTPTEKNEFKKLITSMKRKADEENFDEAVAQAYRIFSETKVPSDIADLFADPELTKLGPSSPPFFHLLAALKTFTEQPPYTLPLTSTLPDMKSDTASYIHLQKLYKAQSEEEKATFATILKGSKFEVDPSTVDEFLRNAHGLKIIRGRKWGAFDEDPSALAESLRSLSKETATHLALSALSAWHAKSPHVAPTVEHLTAYVMDNLPKATESPEELYPAIGEVVRTPTAELPNTAAFLGGLVAQEAIKVITKQYVPVNGICVVDLIGSWTGIIGA